MKKPDRIQDLKNETAAVYEKARDSGKLIHCITNPIAVTRSADAVLALGCRPIMAEHPAEAAEITRTADALLLNLGNITDARIASIRISAETAALNGIPFVIDAVGAACSELRRKLAEEVVGSFHPAVVKGNYSEITALCDKNYRSSGVDTDKSLGTDETAQSAVSYAEKHSCVVMASGNTDIITDGKRLVYMNNGTRMLSRITGTGCMLGALTAVMLTAGEPFTASAAACAVLGIAGELVSPGCGSGSFFTGLMDNLFTFRSDYLDRIKTEDKL